MESEKRMQCKASTLLMLGLALTSVLVTAVIVNAKPLYGEMELYFQPDTAPSPVWSGTISGDINGCMHFYNTGDVVVGQADHFWEIWVITDCEGNMLLEGTDKGVFSMKNGKYRMNGVVTDAVGDYEYLIGHNVHMSGIITFDPDTGFPLTAPGTFRVN
jgi:hypothetical protein